MKLILRLMYHYFVISEYSVILALFVKVLMTRNEIIKIVDQDFDKDLKKLTKTDYEELIDNLKYENTNKLKSLFSNKYKD